MIYKQRFVYCKASVLGLFDFNYEIRNYGLKIKDTFPEHSVAHKLDENDFLNNCHWFRQWLQNNDLHIKNSIFLAINKNILDTQYPHIDATPDETISLNFPVYNTDNTDTAIFYANFIQETKVTQANNDSYYKIENQGNLFEIARYTLTEPIFMNTRLPHQILHKLDNCRYSISLRFIENDLLKSKIFANLKTP